MPFSTYRYDLVQSVEGVDTESWNAVCGPERNAYLDLRFLRAVENSFAKEASFWYLIIRNELGQPIACTCFTKYLVDSVLMAPQVIQNAMAGVRKLWPSFLKYPIMLCGIPVSTCHHQLAIADNADMSRVLVTLNTVAEKLARESGCHLISFKEFPPEAAVHMDALKEQGFLWARSVVAYSLKGDYSSFDEYYDSRSKPRRAKIRKTLKKLEAAGVTCEERSGGEGVEDLFTDDVHRLYMNVLNRAQVKFETIPADFFRELARQLPEETTFTLFRKEGRIVGFCCGLRGEEQHNMLFCGLDYSLNADAELYFNILYRGLGHGLVPGVKVVHIGAAADEFKQHIGCVGESMSIYVRAVGAVRHFLLKQVFGFLFDTKPLPVAAPAVPMVEEKEPIEVRRAA
ncbi:MAG: GNAT family N-acetyltransferase [Planctomycetota bacterium]|nr:MAG: GNAT family N-acetyltransferase [Planctomycetota bacterium]